MQLYHATLQGEGVLDYSFDACWRDYCRFAFAGIRMAINASMMVEQTARGDEMFVAMATRHAQQVLELDALEFLD